MKKLEKYEKIVIWGALDTGGGYEGTASKVLQLLKDKGCDSKVVFWVDSDEAKQGKLCLDKPVYSPSILRETQEALIIINSLSYNAIIKSINEMRIKNDTLIVPYYFYHHTQTVKYNHEAAKKHISQYKNDIFNLYNRTDLLTEKTLEIISALRTKGYDDLYTREFYDITGQYQPYFCDGFLSPSEDVTFVDVGAFDGDSIKTTYAYFGSKMKKCYAFEPEEKQRGKLQEYLKTAKLDNITTVYECALGDKNMEAKFIMNAGASLIDETGTETVTMTRFDDIEGIVPIGDMMIKMDIEGEELNALRGMKNTIQKYKPYLAICIYHKIEDILEIPKFLKQISPEYTFYIRGEWHLECWAIPQRHFQGEKSDEIIN